MLEVRVADACVHFIAFLVTFCKICLQYLELGTNYPTDKFSGRRVFVEIHSVLVKEHAKPPHKIALFVPTMCILHDGIHRSSTTGEYGIGL